MKTLLLTLSILLSTSAFASNCKIYTANERAVTALVTNGYRYVSDQSNSHITLSIEESSNHSSDKGFISYTNTHSVSLKIRVWLDDDLIYSANKFTESKNKSRKENEFKEVDMDQFVAESLSGFYAFLEENLCE